MKKYLILKSKIPAYLKYWFYKTRIENLVFNKTYNETQEGISLILNNTIENKMKINFKASESTQESTTGKNLFNSSLFTTETVQGISLTKNNNGTITLNGTSTARADFRIVDLFNIIGDNKISSINKFSGSTTGNVTFGLYDNNWSNGKQCNITSSTDIGSILLGTDIIYTRFFIRIEAGITLNNLNIGLQIEEGTTATDYEPYTGSQPAPSPDYPQLIHVVKGDNEVVIENKNIIPFIEGTKITNFGITIEVKNGKLVINGTTTQIVYGNYAIWNAFKFSIKAGTYKFSRNNTYVATMLYNLDSSSALIALSSTATEGNVTINNDLDNVIFSMYIPANTTFNNYVCEIQLESGTTKTNWVEHKEQNYTLTLDDLELCNINNYADEIFKNVPECEYYDSMLENGKWYKYGRIGKIDLSTLTWTQQTTQAGYVLRYTTSITDIKYVSSNTQIGNGLAEKYIMHIGSGMSTAFNNIAIDTNAVRVSSIESPTGLFYYELATPTKTLLSNTLQEELENIYNNAHTYNQITNINQINEDRPFIISATYFRKVKY